MQQIFEEIKINTEGQGFYNFTENTLDWIDKQKIDDYMLPTFTKKVVEYLEKE